MEFIVQNQKFPRIACGDAVRETVPAPILEAYLLECEKLHANILSKMNLALDYSGLIGVCSFIVLISTLAIFFNSVQKNN